MYLICIILHLKRWPFTERDTTQNQSHKSKITSKIIQIRNRLNRKTSMVDSLFRKTPHGIRQSCLSLIICSRTSCVKLSTNYNITLLNVKMRKIAYELYIESKRFHDMCYCVITGLTGELLTTEEQHALVPELSSWRKIEIKPC